MFAINIKGKIQKDYNVNLEKQIGSGGLGLRWKLFNGVDKKSKAEVTIFMFSKKDLPKPMRKDNDRFINLLKKEVERGYKFKHPHCLQVIKPMMEIRGEMAFVSERIKCSLSDILGDSASDSVPSELSRFKFGALQLRAGIAQLCDAALFMHNEAHMAHGFISPSTIYVTERGDWKLFGFQFAEHLATEHDEAHLGWDFTNEKEVAYYPPMECSAPEMMISNVMTRKSDVFSIGRVCYILQRQQSGIRREAVIESADQFRRFINDLSVRKEAIPWQGIPETLLPALKRALVCDEKARCNVTDIVNCQYLNDLMVRVIRYLDKLLDKERDGKIKFLKKLPEVISQFDAATLIHKALPPLLLQLQDESMVQDVLPSMIAITAQIDAPDYQRLIEPILRRYFEASDMAQVFYILIENIVLLCSKSSVEGRRENIVPMVVKGLSVRNVAIQCKALQQIPEMVAQGLLEWKDLKSKVLPKLQAICALSVPSGQNEVILPLRVNVLLCFSKIFEKFEAETITKIVVNECIGGILEKTRESAVLMSVLGVLDAVAKHTSPRVVAQHILPKITPLLIESELNQKQYAMFVQSVRYMVNKIDRYRLDLFHHPQHQGGDGLDASNGASGHRGAHSMADILEKEFDPKQKGERFQKDDDPFASSPTITATASAVSHGVEDHTNPFGTPPASSAVSSYRPQSTLSDNTQSPQPSSTGGGFMGFDSGSKVQSSTHLASSSGTDTKTNDNAFASLPSFYGTPSSSQRSPSAPSNPTVNVNAESGYQGMSSSKTRSEAKQSAAPKRKVRAKGTIKKKTTTQSTNKTVNSGFVGFGSAASASSNGSSPGGSAFGFINDAASGQNTGSGIGIGIGAASSSLKRDPFGSGSNVKVDGMNMFSGNTSNDQMFSGMTMKPNTTQNQDLFAGLSVGAQYGSNQSNNVSQQLPVQQEQEQSSFDFMNPQTEQNQNSMFQGFGASPTMGNNVQSSNNNKPSDDPFAGLF